jgi:putative lipoprotein (rSAM/lipoprotein system)
MLHEKITRALLALGLGIIGATVSSCVTALYGAPYAAFRINGTVTGSDGSKGIPGIKVTMLKDFDGDGVLDEYAGTVTESDGSYRLEAGSTSPRDMELTLAFTDTDGDDNGRFAEKAIPVSVSTSDYTDNDDNQWTTGFAIRKVDVTLDPEK